MISGCTHTNACGTPPVFGGPYAEEAESRRRSRFAVVLALGFHGYHPKFNDAIGYFHINPLNRKSNHDKMTKPYDDDVPYEWFEKDNKSRFVLVLWLKDERLTAKPLTTLRDLFNELTPTQPHPYKDGPYRHGLTVKLIGPADSGTLRDLVRESQDLKQKSLTLLNDIEVYSPSATISNCDLLYQGSQPKWDCFKNPPGLPDIKELPIVRTTGTDDVLAAALLWELWQRGVNRDHGYVDPWWARMFEKGTNARKCDDGLVLIGERETLYGQNLWYSHWDTSPKNSLFAAAFTNRCAHSLISAG